MGRLIRLLDKHLEEFFMMILFSIMVCSITMQIFMRKILNDSLSWSEELSRYCFILLVYMGISYAVKCKRHIKIDLLYTYVSEKWKKGLRLLSYFVFLCFCLFICLHGYEITMKLFSLGQSSPALNLPMGFVYAAAPIGLGLAVIRLIQSIVEEFTTPIVKETKQQEGSESI